MNEVLKIIEFVMSIEPTSTRYITIDYSTKLELLDIYVHGKYEVIENITYGRRWHPTYEQTMQMLTALKKDMDEERQSYEQT